MAGAAETFELEAGAGVIDLRGNGFDVALLVGGQPVALNWSDCEGSVGQYLARAGHTDCERELNCLRHTLSGHWLPDVPISSQILPFLKVFAPGRYQLNLVEFCSSYDLIEFDSRWDFADRHDAYYPFETVLVFTQASDSLNPERVNHYIESIRKGLRPIALTATVDRGLCEFVLDGHHKLQAYRQLQVHPKFVRICRLGAPNLTADSFDALVGAAHPMSAHYRRVKTEYDEHFQSVQ